MDSFTELFNKNHKGELLLVVLMALYLVMGFKLPEMVGAAVDHLVGKVVIILVVVWLFLYCNPVVAVMAALVAFDLLRRAAASSGTLASLSKYAPTEEKKMSQFTAFNQFPYTLEQEVVAKMAPIVHSGSSFTQASFKPMLDNLHDASTL
jgi:hypothetical protein